MPGLRIIRDSPRPSRRFRLAALTKEVKSSGSLQDCMMRFSIVCSFEDPMLSLTPFHQLPRIKTQLLQ